MRPCSQGLLEKPSFVHTHLAEEEKEEVSRHRSHPDQTTAAEVNIKLLTVCHEYHGAFYPFSSQTY